MTLGGFAVASCGLFAAGVHAVTVFAKSPVEVYADASRSVVVIHAQQGAGQIARGSGVIVAPEWVVTNCHVVGPASLVTLRRGEQQLPASPGPRDEGADICLVHSLYLSTLRGIAPVRRAISPPKPGSRVFAIRAPHDLELTITEGLLSGTRYRGTVPVMQVSAAISPGSSGGGLFDEDARLIGITTLYIDGGQNLNFAIPVDVVERLLVQARQDSDRAAARGSEQGPANLTYDPFVEEEKLRRRAAQNVPTDMEHTVHATVVASIMTYCYKSCGATITPDCVDRGVLAIGQVDFRPAAGEISKLCRGSDDPARCIAPNVGLVVSRVLASLDRNMPPASVACAPARSAPR